MHTTDNSPKAHPKSRFRWFFLLLALVNLIWAAQGTAVKFLEGKLGPIAITFLPICVTTVLLFPLLIRERRRNIGATTVTWADLWKFAVAGVGGQMLAQLGMTWGITKSLASNAAVLCLLIPVFTAVLASFMLRERITVLRISCLLVGLGGVFLMSMEDLKQSSFLQAKHLVGNLLILAGCLGSSFYNVYCKGLLQRFHEIEILVFSYLAASVASVPLLIWVEPLQFSRLAALDWTGWTALAFLAIFMFGVSMVLFFYVLQHLPVTVASTSLYLIPVFGILLATVFLHEHLTASALAGAAIVLTSTILIMRWDKSAV